MFGGGPCIKVCCGPRCGVDPRHRAVYAAAERACPHARVAPTMCRGLCGDGITLVREDGVSVKVHDAGEVHDRLTNPMGE